MPAHKDFKRLVRARMQKTGEAYTTARLHLLTSKKTSASPAADYAALAGMSDAIIKAKTGCTWDRWVKALDYAGAHAWPHREIAAYVHGKFKIPGWWSQTVTVGYERIKGLRAIGQRRDGTFEANKSKTFGVPLARLYRAWSDRRVRARWLDGVAFTVRGATPGKYIHITWPDGTSVDVGFARRGAEKSQAAVSHQKLASRAAAAQMKTFWAERLSALGAVLSG